MCCASSPDSPAPPDRYEQGAAGGGALAVFDLDGTITRRDTLAPFLVSCLWPRPWRWLRALAALPATVRFAFERDHGALKGAWLHAALGGLSRACLQRATGRFVPRVLRHGLHREALSAIQSHRDRGDRLVLMSASTDLYVPQIGQALGFDEVICTQVRWTPGGVLDGRLASPNCRGAEKQRQLMRLIERERPARVYAYGNSRADLLHMQLAQEAYLVNSAAPLGPQLACSVRRLRWRR